MLLLAIESSGPACSAALAQVGDDGVPRCGSGLQQRQEAGSKGQADRLIALIDALLEEAGHRFADVSLIAVGAGPGSFTGVRTAVAAARGLALAMRRPVLPVTTLEALAFAGAVPDGAPSVAILDARRGEVYAQRFAAYGYPLGRAQSASPAVVAGNLDGPCWLVGDGAPLVVPHLEPARILGVAPVRPDAGGVARAAEARLAQGAEPGSGFALHPVYLREPDARPMAPVRSVPTAATTAAHPDGC